MYIAHYIQIKDNPIKIEEEERIIGVNDNLKELIGDCWLNIETNYSIVKKTPISDIKTFCEYQTETYKKNIKEYTKLSLIDDEDVVVSVLISCIE